MSTLQLALIVAGVLLVIAVLIYNAWQERRLRGRGDAALRPAQEAPDARTGRRRFEPTLGDDAGDAGGASDDTGDAVPAVRPPRTQADAPFVVPMSDVSTLDPASGA
ncbi:MAG: hypothetical protein ABI175_09815, partial [Polyangiales bacterium]